MLNSKKFELNQLIDAVGTGEDLQRMLSIFIESTPKILRDINISYIENDLDGLAGSAHKLKATIDMLKITELQNTIRKLDRLSSAIENRQELPHLINKINDIMNQVITEIQFTYLSESKV
jgi:HPt (histidine-containing phosphotransfer) domain-containing protein